MSTYWQFFYFYGIIFLGRHWYNIIFSPASDKDVDTVLQSPQMIADTQNPEKHQEIIGKMHDIIPLVKKELKNLPFGIFATWWELQGTSTAQSSLFWGLMLLTLSTILMAFISKEFAYGKGYFPMIIRTLLVVSIYYFKFFA